MKSALHEASMANLEYHEPSPVMELIEEMAAVMDRLLTKRGTLKLREFKRLKESEGDVLSAELTSKPRLTTDASTDTDLPPLDEAVAPSSPRKKVSWNPNLLQPSQRGGGDNTMPRAIQERLDKQDEKFDQIMMLLNRGQDSTAKVQPPIQMPRSRPTTHVQGHDPLPVTTE